VYLSEPEIKNNKKYSSKIPLLAADAGSYAFRYKSPAYKYGKQVDNNVIHTKG
jgi:hypothetical protein